VTPTASEMRDAFVALLFLAGIVAAVTTSVVAAVGVLAVGALCLGATLLILGRRTQGRSDPKAE